MEHSEPDGTADQQEEQSSKKSPGLVDGLSDRPVSVEEAGDYMVPLNIERLPPETVTVDYFPDGEPQLVIERGTNVSLTVEDHERATTVKFSVEESEDNE